MSTHKKMVGNLMTIFVEIQSLEKLNALPTPVVFDHEGEENLYFRAGRNPAIFYVKVDDAPDLAQAVRARFVEAPDVDLADLKSREPESVWYEYSGAQSPEEFVRNTEAAGKDVGCEIYAIAEHFALQYHSGREDFARVIETKLARHLSRLGLY
jgi:hypothetical protein